MTRPVLIHVHVPKAAGTSINALLGRALQGRGFAYSTPGKPEALAKMPQERRDQLDFVFGHMPYGLHTLFTRPVLYVASLREPRRRVLSFYRFVAGRPQHPLHEYVARATQDFSAFLIAALSEPRIRAEIDNLQVRMIAGKMGLRPDYKEVLPLALEHAGADNFLITDSKHLDVLARQLEQRLGLAVADIPTLNAVASADAKFDAEMQLLDPKARAALERFTRWDAALHTAMAGAIAGIPEAAPRPAPALPVAAQPIPAAAAAATPRPENKNMVHVLGVSMPRSGHHLLEMILKNTLGEAFDYCEFYEQGCCKTIPCTNPVRLAARHGGVFMQKSHDFQLADPVNVPGTRRIVQYRGPVPRALSNYDLHLKSGAEDNVRTFRDFLVKEALYSVRFWRKWIMRRSPEFMLMSYEQLTGDPVKTAIELFKYLGVDASVAQINQGVEKSSGRRGRDNAKFAFNDIYSHRYAKLPVVANFEDLVIGNSPGYFPTRYFSGADSANSLIGLLFHAAMAIEAGDRARAIALAEEAGKQDPDDPVLKQVLRAAQDTSASGVVAGVPLGVRPPAKPAKPSPVPRPAAG